MKRAFLHVFLIALSGCLSWFLFLYRPDAGGAPVAKTSREEAALMVAAVLVSEANETADAAAAADTPAETVEPEPAAAEETAAPVPVPVPPPSESGEPDAEEPSEALAESPVEDAEPDATEAGPEANEDNAEEPAADTEPVLTAAERSAAAVRNEMATIDSSPELLKRAEEEVRSRARKGFKTVLVCSAADQLAIARAFHEPVVLVPRAGLNPRSPHYFQLHPGPPARIEKLREMAPLQRYTQYRDLFEFAYKDLPREVRELRRRVFVRGDIEVFGVLIPAREWALVMSRREAALAERNTEKPAKPRTLESVRRFTLRYARLPGDTFDIRVTEILFADGERWFPQRS
ncbi:MAG: hypothetical protein V3T86_03785 [Planctomycetota bacterium]